MWIDRLKPSDDKEEWENSFIVGAVYPVLIAIALNIVLFAAMAVGGIIH